MVLTVAFVLIRLQQHEDGIPYMDGGWIENDILHNRMTILGCFIHSFHAWFWCLTVFAWGAHLLNKNSASLAYLNQGVYPFYIVHMPLTFAGLSLAKEFGFTGIPAVVLSCILLQPVVGLSLKQSTYCCHVTCLGSRIRQQMKSVVSKMSTSCDL